MTARIARVRVSGEVLVLTADAATLVVQRADGSQIDVSGHPGAPALADVVEELAAQRELLEAARVLLDGFADRVDARGDHGPLVERVRVRFQTLRDRARAWTTASIARSL